MARRSEVQALEPEPPGLDSPVPVGSCVSYTC